MQSAPPPCRKIISSPTFNVPLNTCSTRVEVDLTPSTQVSPSDIRPGGAVFSGSAFSTETALTTTTTSEPLKAFRTVGLGPHEHASAVRKLSRKIKRKRARDEYRFKCRESMGFPLCQELQSIRRKPLVSGSLSTSENNPQMFCRIRI